MNPLNIRGQFQSQWYSLLTKVIKKQMSNMEGKVAVCKKERKFLKLDSEYSIFLHAFSHHLQKKYFTGMVPKWQLGNPKCKHYPNYIYFQCKFIPKVFPCAFYVTRVVFHQYHAKLIKVSHFRDAVCHPR